MNKIAVSSLMALVAATCLCVMAFVGFYFVQQHREYETAHTRSILNNADALIHELHRRQ